MDVTQVNKGLPSIEAHLVFFKTRLFINNLFIQLLHFDVVADLIFNKFEISFSLVRS